MASPITKADKPDKGCRPVVLGCTISLAITGAVAASLALAVWYVIREHDAAEAQRRAQWRQQEFDRLKSGTDANDRARIMDGELLAMLADDSDCVNRVTTLDFSMTMVTPEAAAHVARLRNVREITFYDTKGVDNVLPYARDLPITKLHFSASRVSPDSLRSLADFPQLKRVDVETVLDAEHSDALKSLPPEITVKIAE